MLTSMFDSHHFNEKAQQIRAHVPAVLTRRGLLPKFTSWRLTQDPSTGLVVLFGILNDKYIAAHTPTPFESYFDPRLLDDLTTTLQVPVVPSNSEGLRYAFILDRGQLGQSTAPVDFPNLHADQPLVADTDSHRPFFLMRDETVIESEGQPLTLLFTPLLRYPKILSDYPLTTQGSELETWPRLLWSPERYNDLLRTLSRSAGEFAQAAASLAGLRHPLDITVLVSAPEWTTQ